MVPSFLTFLRVSPDFRALKSTLVSRQTCRKLESSILAPLFLGGFSHQPMGIEPSPLRHQIDLLSRHAGPRSVGHDRPSSRYSVLSWWEIREAPSAGRRSALAFVVAYSIADVKNYFEPTTGPGPRHKSPGSGRKIVAHGARSREIFPDGQKRFTQRRKVDKARRKQSSCAMRAFAPSREIVYFFTPSQAVGESAPPARAPPGAKEITTQGSGAIAFFFR